MNSILKIALLTLLSMVSSSALAEWAVLGENDTSIVYFDSTTIQKADNFIRMWALFDLKKPRVVDVFSYASSKVQYEYDCKAGLVRMLSSSLYPAKMAGGEAVYSSFDPADWDVIVPGSINDGLWKLACGKR